MPNIYLKPDEEIISIIDKLVQTRSKDIILVVPPGAQIWQSSINLKLLKREAANLGKEVTLAVSSDLEGEAARRLGFAVARQEDVPVEEVSAETEEEEASEEEGELEEVVEPPAASLPASRDSAPAPTPPSKQPPGRDIINLLVQELQPEKQEEKFLERNHLSADTPVQLYREDKKPGNILLAAFRAQTKKMVDIIKPQGGRKWLNLRKASRQPEPVVEVPEGSPSDAKRSRFSWFKALVVFILLTFVIVALVCQMVLPTTEITIIPKTDRAEFELTIIGRHKISNVDEDLNEIPLQDIQVSKTKSREFSATGEKQVSEKARGQVTIYNEYSSSPQTLVATTRFESSDGKVFRIERGVTIPGAAIEENQIVPSSVTMEVVADEPGEEHNIGPSNFTIPGFQGTAKFAGFYAVSDEPMTGGAVKTTKVVSAQDIADAKVELSEAAQAEVRGSFTDQVPSDLKLAPDSMLEEVDIILAPEEDDEADHFTVEVEAIISAFLYREEDLNQLIDANVASSISEDKMLLPDARQLTITGSEVDHSQGEAKLTVRVVEEVAWQINIPLLKEELAGLKEREVREYLINQPGIQEARVSFWPFWVKRVPKREERIEIKIVSASAQ